MKALMTEDGKLTIPQELRDRMGLSSQTVLNLYEENGRLVLEKVVDADALSRVIGCLKSDLSTDEIMAYIRGRTP